MADTRAQIVGLQAYMSAGGTYVEDLFSDRDDGSQIMLADPDVLDDLFEAKCANIEADLLGEGWQWVELVEGHYSSTFYNTVEMPVAEAQPTEAEAARLDEIIDTFTKQKASQALSTMEIRALERENQELVNLTEARRFTAEDRARSGVVVRFCHNYAEYHYGRIKPKAQTHKSKNKITPNIQDPQSLYSGALTSDIASIRTDIIRGTLLAHPRLCLDMLAFKMANSILGNYTDICTIELGRQMRPDFDNRPMAERYQQFSDSMNRDWTTQEDSYERFRAFQAMDATDKDRWITWAVITSFNTAIASNDQTSADEAVISMLTIDWSQQWRPDEAFWKRVSKPAMAEMLSPVLGATWFSNRSGLTKNEMAKLLGDVCSGDSNQVTATQAEAIRNWQILGLAPVGQRDATEATETNATAASVPNLDQPEKQDQADTAFTVKKARLIPVKADHGGVAWTTEEILSDDAYSNLQATAEYAQASQSASNAITDAQAIKDKLGAKPGTEKAAMIDAMADKITVIDMTAPAIKPAELLSVPNQVTQSQETQSQVESHSDNPDRTDCASGKSAMPNHSTDELELPDFLKRN